MTILIYTKKYTLQEYLKSIGHDSLIIKNIQGANKNPSMFRIFGVMADISGTGKPVQVTDGSQIIVFDKKVTKENKLLEVQEKYLNELSFVELKEIAKVYDIEGVKLKKDILYILNLTGDTNVGNTTFYSSVDTIYEEIYDEYDKLIQDYYNFKSVFVESFREFLDSKRKLYNNCIKK